MDEKSEDNNELSQIVDELSERLDDLSEILINRKIYKRFSTWVSIAAILVSIVAICTSLEAFSLDSYAYIGIIVAILALLVAVLIGWQIYKVIELKSHKEEIRESVELKFKSLRKKRAIT